MNGKEELGYATAYYAHEEEWSTTGLFGFRANTHSERGHNVAGEMVRLTCELSGAEVRRRRDGVIAINHRYPSVEGAPLRRISNRIGKIVWGALVGESQITTYTPILDSELSREQMEEFEKQNEALRDIKFRKLSG